MFLGLIVYFLPMVFGAPPEKSGKLTTIAPTTVGTTKRPFMGNPAGHCQPECVCAMKGQYYSAGERWVLPGDTCTIYQCFADGSAKPVQSGCLFRGECKAGGSTWSAGCNNYTCVQHGATHRYQLAAVGCSGSGGGCVAVGETMQEGCDILQCQINTGRLGLAVITTGCTVEGGCKPPNSFWHDGCQVYTCAMELQKAVPQRVDNATMHWPDGHYALIKPQTGCPSDVPEQWTDGYRKLFGSGNNSVSIPYSMAGNSTTGYLTHQVCIHNPGRESRPSPRYQTYWEPGRYCLLRSNGLCPRGFKDGYILLDDNNDTVSMANGSGVLPNGDFGIVTGLIFCCRDDGDVREEIVLPKDTPFVLFMRGDRKHGCQSVRGMTHVVEQFTHGGAPNAGVQNGTLPTYRENTGDITIYLCLYTPIDCGCTDGVGGSVLLNAERTVDCITTRCVADRGSNRLEFVKGGCSVDGRCEAEDAQWSVTAGGACTQHTCRRVQGGDLPRFQVADGHVGCIDGSVCRDVLYEKLQGCQTSRCVNDTNTWTPMFTVMETMCPWMDSCQPANATWRHGCITYRCDVIADGHQFQWSVQPVEYGCSENGKCYHIGEAITGKCYDAICRLNENKTMVYIDVIKGGCTWLDGICKQVNVTWSEGCHDFICIWTSTEEGFTALVNATSVSCDWNGTCYKEGAIWSEGCVDYTCVVTRHQDQMEWGIETARLACLDFNQKCLSVGENFTENCVTYQCQHAGDKIGLQAISTGCEWKTECKPENSTWTDQSKCVNYKCAKERRPSGSVMRIGLVDYGCVFNNTCKAVNETWKDGCRTRQCTVEQTGQTIRRSTAAVSAECDDEGVCRPLGYKKMTAACMEYACAWSDEHKDAFFTLYAGACRYEGKCHPENSTWEEKTAGMCATFRCQKTIEGYMSKLVEQSCRSTDGRCQTVGSAGFQADIQGQLRNNCTCVTSPNKQAGISLKCTGL